MLSDALGSVQAILAGALIWAFRWNWVDPVASMLIGVLVIYSAWSLIQQSVAVLMESAPGHLNVDTSARHCSNCPACQTSTTCTYGPLPVVSSLYQPM